MMTISRTMGWLAALAAAGVLGGCAGYGHGMHGMHGMQGGAYGPGGGACPMQAEMQQKMAAAKTPEERQALMAEHQKSMGMGMGAGNAGGMQCPMMQPATK